MDCLLFWLEVTVVKIRCERCDKEAFKLEEDSHLFGDYFCEECRSE